MSNTALRTTTVLSTEPPLLRRWLWRLAAAWTAWREETRRQAQMRGLEALSDATLRDIGMAERVLRTPALPALDYERARW